MKKLLVILSILILYSCGSEEKQIVKISIDDIINDLHYGRPMAEVDSLLINKYKLTPKGELEQKNNRDYAKIFTYEGGSFEDVPVNIWIISYLRGKLYMSTLNFHNDSKGLVRDWRQHISKIFDSKFSKSSIELPSEIRWHKIEDNKIVQNILLSHFPGKFGFAIAVSKAAN